MAILRNPFSQSDEVKEKFAQITGIELDDLKNNPEWAIVEILMQIVFKMDEMLEAQKSPEEPEG